jgi:catechol 2,3-dioxygenase-like lactoylglutathione lyase family enzyme
MLKDEKIMAFVATSDGVRARAFYEGALGLTVKYEDDFALVLVGGGSTLRIQKLGKVSPAGHTVLGWEVLDIKARITELGSKGVTFERYAHFQQDELGIWTAPSGARVAWFKDPDGNVLSLTQ